MQVEITDHEGLHIKKVISKYDLPDSILATPDHYFIRGAKFRELKNDEFVFDLKIICYGDDGCFPPKVKYYIHLVDGIRFETYPDPDIANDSTIQVSEEWDVN